MAQFEYRRWGVSRRDKQPLLDFLCRGLEESGCRVLSHSDPSHAPFFIAFETDLGERHGVLAYAFLANSRPTRNRPPDEHRFQIKYGSDPTVRLPLEQDPAGLVTTVFVGIDPEEGVMVGADPVVHDNTKTFISLEFKRAHVDQVLAVGWHAWERDSRAREGEPVEVLVGVARNRVLDFIRFERLGLGLDAGHRQLLAEQLLGSPALAASAAPHALSQEFSMHPDAILDLIQGASRLKMAVRGWVAEVHLEQYLRSIPGVDHCSRLEGEGLPDIELQFRGGRPILIECKNVLRNRTADGSARVDFQRTRASMGDPCSRYYRPADFQILAACLHAVTERWEYRFMPTLALPQHARCAGRIQNNLQVRGWYDNPADAFAALPATP